ncbi:hypothetical protein QF035_002658 [Streptomyces umbrinus]|uniref:Uncharacterized protein n=1 Tax=Streptomyces umbrinus TaxID=67370 RepID=A0ABU0SQU9_9ACTN|nr:DUF5988 family protein [Streptomyces umbrinus]MDQ1025076.1 hypothetical protein [Streptomyces umbrinus]
MPLITGPEVVRADGPDVRARLAESARVPAVAVRQRTEVEHYCGYQYPEPFDAPREGVGGQPTTFRWTGFTKIAE